MNSRRFIEEPRQPSPATFPGGKAERLGGLEVDDQIDFCDLLHREVGRLVAFENAPSIEASFVVHISETAAIAHQPAGQSVFAVWEHRGEGMTGSQRHKLFYAPGEEVTVADQDRTNALLQKSCESCFKIAIGSGIHNNELQAQRSLRRLQPCNDGLYSRSSRVRENAERGSTRYQLAEQLQSFRRQLGH
jgi:hypothetical protein